MKGHLIIVSPALVLFRSVVNKDWGRQGARKQASTAPRQVQQAPDGFWAVLNHTFTGMRPRERKSFGR